MIIKGIKMLCKVVAAILGVAIGINSVGAHAVESTPDTYKVLSLFGDVFERVRAQYVTVPDEKKMIQGALSGMVAALDPHSYYMNPEEARAMMEDTQGQFGGIGFTVMRQDKVLKIVSTIKDSPAYRAHLKEGDLISQINHVDVKTMSSLQEAVKKMHGAVGTFVTLTIVRAGTQKPFDVKLRREIIKVPAVKYNVNHDVGYIKLIEFTDQTYDGLTKAIKDIQSKIPRDKLKGYIIDLRLDPGGLLDQAVKVADAFLDDGVIVSTKGRIPNSMMRFVAHKGELVDHKPLVVLINGGTASAAEILAGALHDHHRATVVGTRSFGKGSVQSIIPLGKDGALRLTIALYYTPSGESIQGRGIAPDYVVNEPVPEKYKAYKVTLGESELQGHIKGKEEGKAGSGSSGYVPLDPKEDVQLKAAYDLLHGIKPKAVPAVQDSKKEQLKNATQKSAAEPKAGDKKLAPLDMKLQKK